MEFRKTMQMSSILRILTDDIKVAWTIFKIAVYPDFCNPLTLAQKEKDKRKEVEERKYKEMLSIVTNNYRKSLDWEEKEEISEQMNASKSFLRMKAHVLCHDFSENTEDDKNITEIEKEVNAARDFIYNPMRVLRAHLYTVIFVFSIIIILYSLTLR